MNKLKAAVWVVLAGFSLSFVGTAYADENPLVALKNQMAESDKAKSQEVDGLKNQVNDLNKKLSMLESKLSSVENKVGSATPAYVQTGSVSDAGNLSGIEVHGFIDTQYNVNFRQPNTPDSTTNTNVGRIFDNKDGTFGVNAAEIDIEKKALEPGQAGFRADVMFGEDANVVNGDGNDATSDVDLQQAYVEYIAPLNFFEGNSVLPSSVNIKAGRFVTLAGLEVIEAPDNWNISRSFMFGLGIPFTHTGVRTNFGLFNDFFDVYLGLNNGWDVAQDNNSFKTLENGLGYTLFEKLHMFHSIYWGGENAGRTNNGSRFLNTNTATYDITDKLSVMGEINFARQNDVGTLPTPEANIWSGYAAYARYQFTPKFALSSRSELFRDDDVARGLGAAGGAQSDRTFGQTFTAEYKLTDQLISRAEFRFDKANDDNIYGGAGTAAGDSSQTTIGAQMIYVV
ncbi:MAG: porin [Candidatus Omnitrophica bacterium]|nr:porin [Candidatus Omnitrophota bacterium]